MELYKSKEWLTEQLKTIKYKQRIGEIAGCSGDTIEYWRKKFNLPNPIAPAASKKYFLNEDYFKTIDTEEKAYWLGFIMADGCISTSHKTSLNNRLSIILQKSDYKHLEKLIEALEYTGKIIFRELHDKRGFDSSSAELRINSKHLCNILISLGVVPRKTGKENIPSTLPEKYEKDFIRGFFDGDGYVGPSTTGLGNRVHIGSTSKIILDKIQKILSKNDIEIKEYCTNRYSVPFYYLESNNHHTAKKFLEYLYKDSTVYLDRKYAFYKNLPQVKKDQCH